MVNKRIFFKNWSGLRFLNFMPSTTETWCIPIRWHIAKCEDFVGTVKGSLFLGTIIGSSGGRRGRRYTLLWRKTFRQGLLGVWRVVWVQGAPSKIEEARGHKRSWSATSSLCADLWGEMKTEIYALGILLIFVCSTRQAKFI